jgi:hypothetical protein
MDLYRVHKPTKKTPRLFFGIIKTAETLAREIVE